MNYLQGLTYDPNQPYQKHVRKFGLNGSASTTFRAVWSLGTAYPWLTAAVPMRVKAGGNAADTIAGLGARRILIEGLDENWELVQEIIELAGASASADTNTTFIRVFRAVVMEVGAYGAVNVGDIEIETNTGTTLAVIEAEKSQTAQCVFTIPAGYVGMVSRVSGTSETGKPAEFQGRARINADLTTGDFSPVRVVYRRLRVQSDFTETFQPAVAMPPKTDLWVLAKKNSSGTASVTAELDITLIPLVAYTGPLADLYR